MQKEKYIRAQMEITEFETEDVITSSAVDGGYTRGSNETEMLIG